MFKFDLKAYERVKRWTILLGAEDIVDIDHINGWVAEEHNIPFSDHGDAGYRNFIRTNCLKIVSELVGKKLVEPVSQGLQLPLNFSGLEAIIRINKKWDEIEAKEHRLPNLGDDNDETFPVFLGTDKCDELAEKLYESYDFMGKQDKPSTWRLKPKKKEVVI